MQNDNFSSCIRPRSCEYHDERFTRGTEVMRFLHQFREIRFPCAGYKGKMAETRVVIMRNKVNSCEETIRPVSGQVPMQINIFLYELGTAVGMAFGLKGLTGYTPFLSVNECVCYVKAPTKPIYMALAFYQ